MLSKEKIVELLKNDDRAVIRALLVLNNRQTNDEQSQEQTRYRNGRGFRPCHARVGSSMAKFFLRNNYLTAKQIAYWRVLDSKGNMRIAIYWQQLQEAAKEKSAAKAVQMATVTDVGRDFGNDMERRMVLQEQYNDVLDSDDPKLIDPLKEEIDKIDAFWQAIRSKQPK